MERENIEQFPKEKWDHYLPSVTAKKMTLRKQRFMG